MLLMCIKIFCTRIIDVSLGTVRTVMTVKNKNIIAMLIGFIEISVWFLVVKDALNTTNGSFWVTIAYASGFSVGTYVGGIISNTFIHSDISVQIIMNKASETFIESLRENGYAVTVIPVGSIKGTKKNMLFLEIDSRRFNNLKQIIKMHDNSAFIVVNETKEVYNGYFGECK